MISEEVYSHYCRWTYFGSARLRGMREVLRVLRQRTTSAKRYVVVCSVAIAIAVAVADAGIRKSRAMVRGEALAGGRAWSLEDVRASRTARCFARALKSMMAALDRAHGR